MSMTFSVKEGPLIPTKIIIFQRFGRRKFQSIECHVFNFKFGDTPTDERETYSVERYSERITDLILNLENRGKSLEKAWKKSGISLSTIFMNPVFALCKHKKKVSVLNYKKGKKK